MFEEVTPAWDDELELLRDEYPYWISEPQRDHTGIAILSKIPDNEVEITVIGQNSPPSIVSRFDLAGSRVMLIATHPAPPFGHIAMETKKRHFEALAGLIDSHEGVVIVLGDLNMTSRSSLFQWFINKTDLKDSRLGYGLQATYPAGLSLLGIDLDHALVSSGITVYYRGTWSRSWI